MRRKLVILPSILLFSLFIAWSCNVNNKKGTSQNVHILIETEYGTMKAKLYNETPIHRDNMVQKIESGAYNDVIFHRVIKEFMIQGGDPSTNQKETIDDKTLEEWGKTIPAEINPLFYHKKGALAAARTGDHINPNKESSGTQFYIVQGKTFTQSELNNMAFQKSQNQLNGIINNMILAKAEEEIEKGINPNYNLIYQQLKEQIDSISETMEPYQFTQEQLEIYSTVGGTPHLDGDYTVFGEVIEGFDVIDKIAAVKTEAGDRPEKAVTMKIKIVK